MIRNVPRYLMYFSCTILAAVLVSVTVATTLPSSNSKTAQYSPAVIAAFRAGEDALRAGRPEEAVTDFRKVLGMDPQCAEAQINLGLSYHLLGKYHQAAAEHGKGHRGGADQPGPRRVPGIGYLKRGLPPEAIPSLREALRQDPTDRGAQVT